MKEVYLVTRGRYSDYSVYGVFADKDLATEYAEQLTSRWDDARVEPRPLHTSVDDLMAPIGFRAYEVNMDQDGNSHYHRDEITDEYKDRDGYEELDWANNNGTYTKTGRYVFYIVTDKGEEGAIKIANERRIQMIANGTWPKKGDVCDQSKLF